MSSRLKWLFLSGVAITLLVFPPAYSQNKFKLKPDAKGKLCLDCHDNFKEKLKNPFIHTPVKSGECTGCHNPHTSSHGKLLDADPNKICNKCRERREIAGQRRVALPDVNRISHRRRLHRQGHGSRARSRRVFLAGQITDIKKQTLRG